MAVPLIKTAVNAGEISPAIYGRVDLEKYKAGCATLRNMFAAFGGGASSRPGTLFVGAARQSGGDDFPPQLIPFQFSVDQGYVLVFSNLEMSVVANGAFVTEDALTISTATLANPGVFTLATGSFSPGDWVFLDGMAGMTELNGGTFSVSSGTSSFSLQSIFTGAAINTSTYSAYVTGSGTAAKIFVLATPYLSADLQALKWAQSADVMSLVHPKYPPMDLTRIALNNWTLTTTSFSASIVPPANTYASASTTTSGTQTQYQYEVTAVDALTGEESTASSIATANDSINIATSLGSVAVSWLPVTGAQYYNIYKAAPAIVSGAVPAGAQFGYAGAAFGLSFIDANVTPDFAITPPSHQNPFAPGAIDYFNVTSGGTSYSQFIPPRVFISDATGTGAAGEAVVQPDGTLGAIIVLNGGHDYSSPVVMIGGTTTGSGFAASAVSNGHGTWDGGGTVNGTVTISATGSSYSSSDMVLAQYIFSGTTVTLVAHSVTVGVGGGITAVEFPFTVDGAKPPFASVTISAGSVGSGAAATAHVGPTTGTYPSVVAYFQDRRFYANTPNQPDTYFASQPGAFTNFDKSIPTVASDAVIGTPFAQQVNGILDMCPMPGGLLMFNGGGVWQLSGGGGVATPFSATDQFVSPQAYNGAHAKLQAFPINFDVLYVTEKGPTVRDINYNFFANIYTGVDLTLLSGHLFAGYDIERWAWAQEPYKLMWLVRNDGQLLSLTYMKEQDIYAWARHDTNGQFESVVSVTEPPVDAVYFVTSRAVL